MLEDADPVSALVLAGLGLELAVLIALIHTAPDPPCAEDAASRSRYGALLPRLI